MTMKTKMYKHSAYSFSMVEDQINTACRFVIENPTVILPDGFTTVIEGTFTIKKIGQEEK